MLLLNQNLIRKRGKHQSELNSRIHFNFESHIMYTSNILLIHHFATVKNCVIVMRYLPHMFSTITIRSKRSRRVRNVKCLYHLCRDSIYLLLVIFCSLRYTAVCQSGHDSMTRRLRSCSCFTLENSFHLPVSS